MGIEELKKLTQSPPLQIDIGAKLIIKIDGVSSIAITSYFVGMVVDEYIAIQAPSPFTSIKHKIFPGSQFVLRYLNKGSIYAFQSKVIDMISKPSRLVFLEYPKMVTDRNIRATKRNRCSIPARCATEHQNWDVVIVDISKKGCRLQLQPPAGVRVALPRKEEAIAMSCQFPGVAGEKGVKGTVRNVQRKKDIINLGIEFVDITRDFQNNIAQYILAVEVYA